MPELEQDINEKEVTFDESKLLDDDKGSEEKQKEESSASKETKEEETSKEESTRSDTSIKTEDESKEEEKKEEVTDEDTRFDKHPRWQKLQQERNEALDKARQFDELKTKLEGFETDELTRLKEAGKLLRKYPELADKVQKTIDEHPFGNEEVKTEVTQVKQELMKMQQDLALEKYDNTVEKLISEHKVDKEILPFVKELFDNRVINQKAGFNDLPRIFDKTVKDVEMIRRKTLANHIESKSKETKVPASPTDRGKAIISKKESAEFEDVASEIAAGLKSSRSEA